VKRFNVCTNQQLSDFATGLPGPGEAFAVRLLPGGGALVADTDSIVQLDSSGTVVHQYGMGETTAGTCVLGETTFTSGWFSLALDSSGTSFWAGDYVTGVVSKFTLGTPAPPVASFSTGGTLCGGAADGLSVAP
jgi:hypothetical protein